ncbi:MAG: hypothetical protein K1060chlam2_01320 [Chlamydiae bacterium]|nr:hypothetical protein [Chlamydiota bacterium]
MSSIKKSDSTGFGVDLVLRAERAQKESDSGSKLRSIFFESLEPDLTIDRSEPGYITIKVTAKLNPGLFDDSYYALEEDVCPSKFDGDFQKHIDQKSGHHSLKFPVRIDLADDEVGCRLKIGATAKSGNIVLDIPLKIFKFKFKNNAKPQVLFDLESPTLEKIVKAGGSFFGKISIRQEFLLKDYELTIKKGGVEMLRIDLKDLDAGFA